MSGYGIQVSYSKHVQVVGSNNEVTVVFLLRAKYSVIDFIMTSKRKRMWKSQDNYVNEFHRFSMI